MKQMGMGIAVGLALAVALAAGFGYVAAHSYSEAGAVYMPYQAVGGGQSMPCGNLEDMDANGDSICDYCGMSIEACESMHGNGSIDHEAMHEAMHGATYNNASGYDMPCHM